jgi:hypothetical protein
MTLYFKRHWSETTGEEPTEGWGKSTYYFETDIEGNVSKQIQIFENGNCLKYDTDYLEDKFGNLSEVTLDLSEFKEFQIDKVEFENIWETPRFE